MRITVVAGLLMILTVQVPASARTLHVPSVYPTIQQAVDAAAASGDSILVDSGSYPEDVAITSKSVVIVGAGPENTSTGSFTWAALNYQDPSGGSLIELHVDGSLQSQLSQSLTLRRCSVEGSTNLDMMTPAHSVSVSVDASVFQGQVTISGHADYECLPHHFGWVRDCEFHSNVSVGGSLCGAEISRCVFYGNASGSVYAQQTATVVGNTLLGTGGLTITSHNGRAIVSDNMLSGGEIVASYVYRDCDILRNTGARRIYVDCSAQGSATIEDNVIRSGVGMYISCRRGSIRRNAVIASGYGIAVVPNITSMEGIIENNTIYACGGAGIRLDAFDTNYEYVVRYNAVTRNGRGIDFNYTPAPDHILCNDVFDNPGGNWIGADFGGINGNFALNPLFCAPEDGDFTLAANSPCLPENGTCGLVGALGEGCLDMGACCQSDGTCALTTEANCQAPGIWQGAGITCDPNPCVLGACCLYVTCDVYSAEACALHGGVFMGNGTLCEPNPCVSGVDDASQVTALRLTATPNPSTGQVMIQYTMPKPTTVSIEVFDAAGGLVRRIEEGTRPAGRHSVPWDARDENGNALASGVYLARIVTMDGTTTGRVVLAR